MKLSGTIAQEDYKPESSHVVRHGRVVIDSRCSRAFLFGDSEMKLNRRKRLCECGCGEEVNPGSRFIRGHHVRINNPSNRPEVQKKMSASLSGKNNPMYGKRGKDNPNYGKKQSVETKNKIGQANRGRKRSKEEREKMSKRVSGPNHPLYGKFGPNNPNYGKQHKKHNDHTKRKLSKAALERWKDKKYAIAVSIGNMKCRTDEYCDAWSDVEYKKDCKKDHCEKCGVKLSFKKDVREHIQPNLILHHKDKHPSNCSPDNLMTVCRGCHNKLHRRTYEKAI
jgi:hypothetical protein